MVARWLCGGCAVVARWLCGGCAVVGQKGVYCHCQPTLFYRKFNWKFTVSSPAPLTAVTTYTILKLAVYSLIVQPCNLIVGRWAV